MVQDAYDYAAADLSGGAAWVKKDDKFGIMKNPLTNRDEVPTTGYAVMGGVGDNRFDPLGTYTREQAIMTVLRLFNAAG